MVIKRSDSGLGPLNRSPQRMAGKISGVEQFAEQFVGCVLNHFHLFEDDFLLTF